MIVTVDKLSIHVEYQINNLDVVITKLQSYNPETDTEINQFNASSIFLKKVSEAIKQELDSEWQERNAHLNARDQELLSLRMKQYLAYDTPIVGDYIEILDGSIRRFTHKWFDGLQTTVIDSYNPSFYLGNGYASFSGSLDPTIKFSNIQPTNKHYMAKFWFFHHDLARAHNGVEGWFRVKVWKEV